MGTPLEPGDVKIFPCTEVRLGCGVCPRSYEVAARTSGVMLLTKVIKDETPFRARACLEAVRYDDPGIDSIYPPEGFVDSREFQGTCDTVAANGYDTCEPIGGVCLHADEIAQAQQVIEDRLANNVIAAGLVMKARGYTG